MFEKLTQFIIDSEPTVLNSATPDYEPHDYKLIVLEDVLTDEEIGYCKFAFNDPDIIKFLDDFECKLTLKKIK